MRRILIALTLLAAAGALAAGCGGSKSGHWGVRIWRRVLGDHGRPVGR
jgi:hypothetical protein